MRRATGRESAAGPVGSLVVAQFIANSPVAGRPLHEVPHPTCQRTALVVQQLLSQTIVEQVGPQSGGSVQQAQVVDGRAEPARLG